MGAMQGEIVSSKGKDYAGTRSSYSRMGLQYAYELCLLAAFSSSIDYSIDETDKSLGLLDYKTCTRGKESCASILPTEESVDSMIEQAQASKRRSGKKDSQI